MSSNLFMRATDWDPSKKGGVVVYQEDDRPLWQISAALTGAPKGLLVEMGRQKPTKEQLVEAKRVGDASFIANPSREIFAGSNLPRLFTADYDEDSLRSIISLKMKNVTPHMDCPVEHCLPSRKVGSMFWLLHAPAEVHLQVGSVAVKMLPGDFVVFNDGVTHSVQSTKQWVGVAVQVPLHKHFYWRTR